MKQTVRTKNYNAVIEIPYEKLAKKSNCIGLDTLRPEPSGAGKTLLISNCHGCHGCQPAAKQSNFSIEMLEELEKAFEADMKEKDEKIGELEKEVRMLGLQLTGNNNQRQKYKAQIVANQTKYLQIVKSLKFSDDQFKKWKTLYLEKQTQSSKYLEQAQKLQIRVQQLQKQLRNVTGLKNKAEEDMLTKINSLEEIIKARDTEIGRRLGYEKDIEGLNTLILGYTEKIRTYQQKILGYQQKQITNSTALSAKNSQIQTIKQKLQQNEQLIKDKNQQIMDKELKIQILIEQMQNQIGLLSQKLTQTQSRNIQLQNSLGSLDLDYKYLHQKAQDYQIYIDQLTKQISKYKATKLQLETTILQKQEELKKKEGPKMYEVKIEKVIDRQQYIEGLERELETVKRSNLQLVANLRDREKIILGREKQLQEARIKISQLEVTIRQLKKYIQQKQKSFAWIVQRQIARDIQLTQHEPTRTYKVYPGELKTNPIQQRNWQYVPQPYEQYGGTEQRKIYINARIDSTNILDQLSETNEGLRNVIEREAGMGGNE